MLLTGAAGGFGQEFTRQLLQAGSRLILTDVNPELLQDCVTQIRQQIPSGEVLAAWPIDLSTAAGCDILYEQVKTLGVPIEILINNAGMAVFGRMDEVPRDRWELLMQINLLTPMRLSALFAADMIARRQGHIVNIASIAGWSVPRRIVSYGASKFGLRGFSQGLRRELQPHGVKVTVVYPFFSRTPILQPEMYGSFAETKIVLPNWMVSEPSQVIQSTLRGIQNDRQQIFPDRIGRAIYFLKAFITVVMLIGYGVFF